MIVVAIGTKSTAVHELSKFTFSFFHIETRNKSTAYPTANDKPNYYTMSRSYQTIPPANAPKDEPSSTPVPMMKKIVIAAMVGTAVLVVGYSYGASNNPAMFDIATTTMTTTATAANSFAEMEKVECSEGPCKYNRNEKVCLSGNFTKGCKWYPHLRNDVWDTIGFCSSCAGVNCGNHRAFNCKKCKYYEGLEMGKNYCNGECTWDTRFNWRRPRSVWPQCYPK
mmetsp:Transcript_11981/g.13701  ORF Transcript_11981/g.13701 Transcript_11981/m.13701 type:complete len:224 (-) Transcript_11981:63-734(-)